MLGLTCRALSAQLSPDGFVGTESAHRDTMSLVMSRLPNGVFHGASIYTGREECERILYNRGQIVTVDYTMIERCENGPSWRRYVRDVLVNGYAYRWALNDDSGTELGSVTDAGCDTIYEFCTLHEFDAVATRLGMGLQPGERTHILVVRDWVAALLPWTTTIDLDEDGPNC